MATITNDYDLRRALNELSAMHQRVMGARFAMSVIHLCPDERVRRAVEVALDPEASDTLLEDALKAVKHYATTTYTDCGKDTDWQAQAGHFVAAAATAALTPMERIAERANPAWRAAVQARMAKNCETMEQTEGETESESDRQYRIASTGKSE